MITAYKIYADNAATTSLSRTAMEAMLPYFNSIYANPSSLHSAGQRAKYALNKSRSEIAALIGAEYFSEITFTSGGTESDNQAIITAALLGADQGKRHIVSTAFEHHAVLNTLDKLKKQDFEITLVSPESNGIINPADIEAAIRSDTALVSVMYVNNEIGTIQPISEIGEICRKRSILFHTDAVGAAGHINIDVISSKIDLLSLSAHKFHGPKGIGALYTRKGIKLSRVTEGGGQEFGSRPGTENLPAIIGMTAALKESVQNIDKNNIYLAGIRNKIMDSLLKIPGSSLNGDKKKRLAGNINISFNGINSDSLIYLLDSKGISASSGSACTSSSTLPSHVLTALGIPDKIARGTLRLSLGENTTRDEAEYIIKSVTEAVNELYSISPAWKRKK